MATVLGNKLHKLRETPLTIPDIVQERLGLEEGDGLLFIEEEGRIFIQREAGRPLSELVGSWKVDRPASADFDDEIEEAIDIAMREKYPWVFEPGR